MDENKDLPRLLKPDEIPRKWRKTVAFHGFTPYINEKGKMVIVTKRFAPRVDKKAPFGEYD